MQAMKNCLRSRSTAEHKQISTRSISVPTSQIFFATALRLRSGIFSDFTKDAGKKVVGKNIAFNFTTARVHSNRMMCNVVVTYY
jgi:hypothetical protein